VHERNGPDTICGMVVVQSGMSLKRMSVWAFFLLSQSPMMKLDMYPAKMRQLFSEENGHETRIAVCFVKRDWPVGVGSQ
jgi:hypothetical protein